MLTVEGEVLYKKAVYILQYCDELQADCSSTLRVRPPVHIGIPPMLSTVVFSRTVRGISGRTSRNSSCT